MTHSWIEASSIHVLNNLWILHVWEKDCTWTRGGRLDAWSIPAFKRIRSGREQNSSNWFVRATLSNPDTTGTLKVICASQFTKFKRHFDEHWCFAAPRECMISEGFFFINSRVVSWSDAEFFHDLFYLNWNGCHHLSRTIAEIFRFILHVDRTRRKNDPSRSRMVTIIMIIKWNVVFCCACNKWWCVS